MSRTNNVAIIQVRSDSKRFPNKCFEYLGKHKIIDWVVTRVKKAKNLDKVIIATTKRKNDRIFKNFAKKHKVNIFYGNEMNVMQRFIEVSRIFKPIKIVRVCADNPFVSGDFIDKLINFFDKNNCDLAFNHSPNKKFNYECIDGFGAEIFSFKTLKIISRQVFLNRDKEHVTNYLYKNNSFNIKPVPLNRTYYATLKSLDINTIEDLNYLNNFIKKKKIKINSTAKYIASKIKQYN